MWLVPFFIFVVIVVIFVINCFAAEQFSEIASMKGHLNKKYFWWCFWLGIVGWAMVIALPDRANISSKVAIDVDELPEL